MACYSAWSAWCPRPRSPCGLWVPFHPFAQAQYLTVLRHWILRLGCSPLDWGELERAALQWALRRGSRSGRTAWQFARDWAGRFG